MSYLNLPVDGFCNGEYDHNISGADWSETFEYISENYNSLNLKKNRIHTLWTVNGGHLRRKIANDELVAKVLTVALPGYEGNGLTLYRGECRFLYELNLIGFCWTPKIEVAKNFARGLNAIESGGVLLKTFAPKKAILASPNDHSANQMQEFEYTCNPYLLENIELVASYEKRY